MSAKALAACSFEPAAEQTVTTGRHSPEGRAAECQFREDLWREYRREASRAGFSNAEAVEYASALSPDLSLVAGGSTQAPARRGWFYQARPGLAGRAVRSGLLTLARWEKSKSIGRTSGAGTSIFAFRSRPWNAGGRN